MAGNANSASGSDGGRPTAPELTTAALDEDVARTDPHPVYDRLRSEAPVIWAEDPGIWLLSRYQDVLTVNRDPKTFCSSGGILAMEIGITYPSPPTMMHMDAPEHTRLRRAVAEGFRPSRIASLETAVSAHVDSLLDELAPDEPFEVVGALAAPLPIIVICELLGLPHGDWELLRASSDAVIPGAAELSDAERGELNARLEAMLRAHATEGPGLAADLRATGLDDDEVYILINQVFIAGNETTRNLISAGLAALSQRPEQWSRLVSDPGLIPTAVEELLRYTTPVVSFMRTATRDAILGGEQIREGDPVLMLWASANRDAAEFGDDAAELVVDRSPNHHLAFGFGAHFCVGAALARMEARLVLEGMASRFGRLESAGEAKRSPSTIIAGFESVPLVGHDGGDGG